MRYFSLLIYSPQKYHIWVFELNANRFLLFLFVETAQKFFFLLLDQLQWQENVLRDFHVVEVHPLLMVSPRYVDLIYTWLTALLRFERDKLKCAGFDIYSISIKHLSNWYVFGRCNMNTCLWISCVDSLTSILWCQRLL